PRVEPAAGLLLAAMQVGILRLQPPLQPVEDRERFGGGFACAEKRGPAARTAHVPADERIGYAQPAQAARTVTHDGHGFAGKEPAKRWNGWHGPTVYVILRLPRNMARAMHTTLESEVDHAHRHHGLRRRTYAAHRRA